MAACQSLRSTLEVVLMWVSVSVAAWVCACTSSRTESHVLAFGSQDSPAESAEQLSRAYVLGGLWWGCGVAGAVLLS